ncbi:Putative ribonuclease H protein At1g65750 [Linum perenne]
MNSALLCKWIWRFGVERGAWWRHLVVLKCGEDRSSLVAGWSLTSAGWSVWRWIVQSNPCFWESGYIDPGGGGVSFWFDFWVRGVRLCEVFPRIVACALSPDALVFDYCSDVDRSQWRIPLRRRLRGGAERERVALMEMLNNLPPILLTTGPPCVVWPLDKSGVFSVRSLARVLIHRKFPGMDLFPSHFIWARLVPTKVAGFIWQVAHERVSTIDNLIRRGMMIPNRCAMCGKDAESITHLFRECSFASQVWFRFSSRLSVFGPFPLSTQDWFWAWKGMNCSSTFSPCIKVLLHGVLWGLWGERNNRVFRDEESSPRAVIFRIAFMVGRWCSVGGKLGIHSFGDWMKVCCSEQPTVGIG